MSRHGSSSNTICVYSFNVGNGFNIMRFINKIVVHCSATPAGRDVTVDEIRRWHVEERKWSDIGYHYVIHLDGSVHEGRPIERSGSHVRGHNRSSIGICYVGGASADDFTIAEDTRTDAQKIALKALIKGLLVAFPGSEVCGHNNLDSRKSCPNFNVSKDL